MRRPPFLTGPSLRAASSTDAADAPRPSSATVLASEPGPRRLLNTTSWPAASASRANASATVPAPIVPTFMLSLSVSREIDQNDAGAAGPADMRHRVGDPGGRIALGNLEQRRRLARQAQCERDVGFALLRRLQHPTAEHDASERQRTWRKQTDVAHLAAERAEIDDGSGPLCQQFREVT